jgi:FixJ family two-component response regulator
LSQIKVGRSGPMLCCLRRDALAADGQAMKVTGGNGAAKNPVVVVIDDDPAVLNSLKFALEIEGLAVEGYRTGREALEAGRVPTNGCLVIDFRLPDMDGLEVLRKLRERKITAPALLITSHPSPGLRARAAAAGVPIVEKPLFGNVLLDSIRAALSRPSQRTI